MMLNRAGKTYDGQLHTFKEMDYSEWQTLDIVAKPFDSFVTLADSKMANSEDEAAKADKEEEKGVGSVMGDASAEEGQGNEILDAES